MIRHIVTPLSKEVIESLSCGDSVTLTGYIYTARDAAHKRLCGLIEAGKELPFDIKDQVIFFAGPEDIREKSRKTARTFPAASASALRSPVYWRRIPPSSFWMRLRVLSMPKRSMTWSRRSVTEASPVS